MSKSATIPNQYKVLATIGDGPVKKVRVCDLTKDHKIALGPMYPLDDFHREDVSMADFDWQVEFGGETRFIRSQEDWDWVKALARISGLLNADGHISNKRKGASDTSNPHESFACLGTMYDVYRFKEDMVTLCDEEGGFREVDSDNSLIYNVTLSAKQATKFARMDGQTIGARIDKPPTHPSFVINNCPIPILRAYLSGCMSGDGCVSTLVSANMLKPVSSRRTVDKPAAASASPIVTAPPKPRRNRTSKAHNEQSIMVADSYENGHVLGHGTAPRQPAVTQRTVTPSISKSPRPTPYTPPTASSSNIHKPTNTDLGNDKNRYFAWITVYIQSAKFKHTSAMIHKLEQMIEMFAKCGITGLSVWSNVGDSPVFDGKKEISSRFLIVQDNPIKNAARWLEISFPYCSPKQIRTELFVAYGLFWAYVNAQRQSVAKIAWSPFNQMLVHIDNLKKSHALQSAQALFEKKHALISKHSQLSSRQFQIYCDKNGVHDFKTPCIGGVTPFLRDSGAREFFNNGGVREVGETYRKHTYATTQGCTALPLYFTRIAAIVDRNSVENCMVFSDLPDGRGLQCDGVLVFKD
ncbi:hypothetical protein H4S07_001611 [Coemansia furcata]|uniref:Uncharacterized protein n=1 Tax=Coemansia furcata TaxID=417177 RepID=A0ACC1LN61_9FUNG|nr:hypothetical protein H4S07_001611 [Coemansia furcata]